MAKREISCEVIKEIAVLSETPRRVKTVRLISWDKRKPVIDIRSWYHSDKGSVFAMKGVTLTYSEITELKKVIDECIDLVAGKQVEPVSVQGSGEVNLE